MAAGTHLQDFRSALEKLVKEKAPANLPELF